MPESHRQFLDALEHSVSVRAYCLREWRKAPVELIAALEARRAVFSGLGTKTLKQHS